MVSRSLCGTLALIALVVCSAKGFVARGFSAGAAIVALGVFGLLLELVVSSASLKQDYRTAQAAFLIAGVTWLGQLVVMALAVSSKSQPVRVHRLGRRKKRLGR